MTKLKDMRLYRGLSQQELAEAAGLNIGTLRHYEQGSKLIDNAKLETILKCALLLENKETISLIYETFKNARY